ncbi:MAG: aminoacetone oxidase family FAD-binding enzyme [Oscillospiraceae bacterium]|nr:aminoacetone oxidase family FAD-binding enzyme [Oscillospiraceae bacterium]
MEKRSCAVIGGGAAGLMAALTASERGAAVTVFERQARVARKLMATGNGRCNLSNTDMRPERYHGDRAFAERVFETFSQRDTLELFHSLGLVTVEEPGGRLYPLSDSAASVADTLRLRCLAQGVDFRTGTAVRALKRAGSGFAIITDEGSETFPRVLVACGGCAGAWLGGVSDGYELLCSLGHRRTKLFPSLVQLKTDAAPIRGLKGIRCDAGVTLLRGDSVIAQSAGEVQFTEYGVSGPAVFDVSRAASVQGGGLTLTLDLVRQLEKRETVDLLMEKRDSMPALAAEDLLIGVLHNRLGRVLIKSAGVESAKAAGDVSNRELAAIAGACKAFTLPVTGTLGFDSAQVTAGGVETADFDPATMESRLVPGLFAAGEVLNVDGDCGGYNLQFAWSTGRIGGLSL